MTVDEAEKLMCPFGQKFGQKCFVDECMAWRWCDPEIKNDGYCGLAGKDGAE